MRRRLTIVHLLATLCRLVWRGPIGLRLRRLRAVLFRSILWLILLRLVWRGPIGLRLRCLRVVLLRPILRLIRLGLVHRGPVLRTIVGLGACARSHCRCGTCGGRQIANRN